MKPHKGNEPRSQSESLKDVLARKAKDPPCKHCGVRGFVTTRDRDEQPIPPFCVRCRKQQ